MPSCPASLKTNRFEVEFGGQGGKEYFDVYPRYKILRSLGSGGFGYVVEAEDTEAEGEDVKDRIVAIKKLPAIFRHEMLTKSALREIAMLKFLKHDNILRIKDLIIPLREDSDGTDIANVTFGDVYMVIDKLDLDLGDLLSSPTIVQADQRKFFVYQILRGLKFIHSAQVLHRDLKPQNILINSSCDLKICDFGLARGYDACGMTKNVTTQWYRAPEILLEMVADDEAVTCCYDNNVDIWSAGCIMAELMLRAPLFKGKAHTIAQVEAVFDVLGTPEPTDDLPEHIKEFLTMKVKERKSGCGWEEIFPPELFEEDERDLVKQMLRFNSAHRISVTAALEHPYLADFHDADDEPSSSSIFSFDPDPKQPAKALLREFADFHPEIKTFVNLD